MKGIPGRSLSFDSVAEDYDRTRIIPAPQRDAVARLCAQQARLKRDGGVFLDAGVGTGRFGAALARLHPGQIIGVDLSLAMMVQARAKVPSGSLNLIGGDLQRLPFRSGALRGALVVHVLHLIERWPLVLAELRRVLTPRTGVLLLGSEQGGRSALVDFYYERARAARVLPHSLGAGGLTQPLALLRRRDPSGIGGAHVELLSAPYLTWKRVVPIDQTLHALALRTYSQMWNIPEETHQDLLRETQTYAARTFGSGDAVETLQARFVLYAVRWPG